MIVPFWTAVSMSNRFLPGHPAVGDGAIPVALELARLADDHMESVVFHIQRLGRALDAVADDSDDLVFEDAAGFGQGEFLAGDNAFFYASKINDCHDSCSPLLIVLC